MLDRTIPYYNMILKCDQYHHTDIILPQGFHFKKYEDGDAYAWADLEYKIGDFDSRDEALEYFISSYCTNMDELKKRCIFLVNEQDNIIGSCIAWRDKRFDGTVASLHWLIVDPDYQGLGLGKSLCQKTLETFHTMNEYPVYLHTQPWSYRAIFIYLEQGFKIQKTDSFNNYENQFEAAMDTLKNQLNENRWEKLHKHIDI